MPPDEAAISNLPERPQEFVRAIIQEIEASKKGETRVRMARGRRIAQIGRQFHYTFDLDTIQHLAPDAPAEVYVGDQKPVQASVVECNGLGIILACDRDFGRQVEKAELHSDLSMLMLRLIDRIIERSEQGNPAGDRLLRGEFSGDLDSSNIEGRLTEGQRNAIRSGLGRDSTFIWGPPGTGKTQTIGTLVAELAKRGRRTLIVSHTNTAIDGALLKVAGHPEMARMVEKGMVLRVGQPRKKELQKRESLLLSYQVERRVVHIQKELTRLRKDLEYPVSRAKGLSKLVDVLEWLDLAVDEAEEIQRQAVKVKRLRDEAHEAKTRWQEKQREATPWWQLAKDSQKLHASAQNLAQMRQDLVVTREQAIANAARQERLAHEIDEARVTLRKAMEEDELATALARFAPASKLTDGLRSCVGQIAECLQRELELDETLQKEVPLLKESEAANRLTRLWKKLPDPKEQGEKVSQTRAERVENADALERLTKRRLEIERDLAGRAELEAKIWEYRAVPFLREVKATLTNMQEEATLAKKAGAVFEARLTDLAWEVGETERRLESFRQRHGESVEDVNRRAAGLRQEADALGQVSSVASRALRTAESGWREDIKEKASLLIEWGFLGSAVGSPEEMAVAVCDAIHEKWREMAHESLAARRQELSEINVKVVAIQEEIDRLEAQLKNAEDAVIADATVIGATLTGAYLRETIQRHRFDTVIVDEVSMAPIPAVWAVAGLADANMVVVGDFLQLPPIVKSEEELAKKWLGRDVFEEAGVYGTEPIRALKDHLMVLDEQFRMDPAISAVPRSLIYQGQIRDGKKSDEDRQEEHAEWDAWFDTVAAPSAPLVLVDTSRLGAWVTTCSKGGNPSRFNLLSASLGCRLLGRSARKGRKEPEEGDEKRCLFVSPYRPHAQLTEIMLRDRGFEKEAQAGTAHAFQGGEADVVVLDLVNDEPHWKVGLFMPDRDKDNLRLLNVALTRAKQRLLVVGDFEYLRKTGRKSFLGGTLVPYLLDNYPLFDARDLLREAFVGLSVEGYVGPAKILTGLREEIHRSQRAIVYSPRLDLFGVSGFDEVCTGVHAEFQPIIVTKPTNEYLKKEQDPHHGLVVSLRARGFFVVFKTGMREQMVVLDHSLWLLTGSLLDSADSDLTAERLSGKRTVDEVADLFATGKIVQAFQDGLYVCPICGEVMELREGNDGPFYWSCPEKGCYTRNADGPELKDGRLVCKHGCGPVEFGWTQTGKPVWRCCDNPRHYVYVASSHLRLPRMMELIPKGDLPKVEGLVCPKGTREDSPKPTKPTKTSNVSESVDLPALFKVSSETAATEAIRRIVKADGKIHRALLLDKGVRMLTNGAATKATKSVLNKALLRLHNTGEIKVEDDWTWISLSNV